MGQAILTNKGRDRDRQDKLGRQETAPYADGEWKCGLGLLSGGAKETILRLGRAPMPVMLRIGSGPSRTSEGQGPVTAKDITVTNKTCRWKKTREPRHALLRIGRGEVNSASRRPYPGHWPPAAQMYSSIKGNALCEKTRL